MARKKVKLAWVENDNSRTISLKKRREGLVKKTKELTILCDIKVCMIIFSPNEVEAMVWPSVEKARDILDDFFALPVIERKKKEMTLESYLKEKTKKVREQLMETHKKNMNYAIDQLMVQLQRGRRIQDLDLSEIYELISFSRDNVLLHRKGLDLVQYPALRDPPAPPVEAQFEEFRTTTHDVILRSGQEDERASKTNEEEKRISTGTAMKGNQSYYLIDQWVLPSPEPLTPRIHQQIEKEVVSYNQNPNAVPYQRNSINENPNMEMEPIGAPVITFHDLVGSVSQPLQHHSMNDNPTMAMTRPNEYPFDFVSREFRVKEEGSIVSKGDSQFHRESNTIAINDGIRKEPQPNETNAGETNDDVSSFDMNN